MLIRRIQGIAISSLPAVLVILGVGVNAYADVLTFEFAGQLTTVAAPVSATFFQGEAYSASFSFDSNAAPTISGPVVSQYPLISAHVTIGSYVATGAASAFNGITVENDHAVPPAPTFDQWLATSFFSGPPVGSEVVGFGDVGLEDSITHTALSSTALPTTLDLPKFNTQGFAIEFCDSVLASGTCVGGGLVLGSLMTLSVTSSAVRHPPTLGLLAVGGLALLGVGWMSRRHATDQNTVSLPRITGRAPPADRAHRAASRR